MTYLDELLSLPVENKNEIKKLENIKNKLLNAKWSRIFNEMRLKEELIRDRIRQDRFQELTSKTFLAHILQAVKNFCI